MSVVQRIPVVAGLAYGEHGHLLTVSSTATLVAEPDNRYFRHAIAVYVAGCKVGYVAPEVARRYFDGVKGSAAPIECPAHRGAESDHETSGVELLLDFSSLPIAPAE